MGRGQNININRNLEEDSNPHGWLWGVEDSIGGRNSNVVEILIARKLEIKMEPEDVTELLQFHDETLTDEKLFLIGEQRK